MKQYLSITHVTSNEHGEEELTLESPLPMWKAVMSALSGIPVVKSTAKSYVAKGTFWVDKNTGERVDDEMQYELFECKAYAKQNWPFGDR